MRADPVAARARGRGRRQVLVVSGQGGWVLPEHEHEAAGGGPRDEHDEDFGPREHLRPQVEAAPKSTGVGKSSVGLLFLLAFEAAASNILHRSLSPLTGDFFLAKAVSIECFWFPCRGNINREISLLYINNFFTKL